MRPDGVATAMRVLAAALALVLAGCFAPAASQPPPADDAPGATVAATRLLVLGDAGTGTDEQKKVAAAAHAVCLARGCEAALMLGDNIYETGVGSVDDPQFASKFEEPYAAFDLPFYLVLGNHDNGGNGLGTEPSRGDFQVAYTEKSEKWRMPDRWYDVRIGDVHLFGLDTSSIFFGGYATHDPGNRAQSAWLQQAIAGSNATWKVSFGHHPYLSNGQHANARDGEGLVPAAIGTPLSAFYEELVCGHVQLILGGHDHDLQWLEESSACPGAEHVVSGAAAKKRSLGDESRNPARFQRGDTLGFAWIAFDAAGYTVAFYDGDGTLLHEGRTARDG